MILQHAQKFLAKTQTKEVLPLANCPTTKETLILPKDLQEIDLDSMVTYAKECVRYHGMSSTDGNSQCVMNHDSTFFDNLLPRSLSYIMIYHYWTIGLSKLP